MSFARRVLQTAGIYGLVVLTPFFFMEDRIGRDYPPPITHAEYFYGFLSVALAWQVMFLFMARDPMRYRLLLIPALLEKIGFPVAAIVLLAQHRLPLSTFAASMVDLLFATLFLVAYGRLSRAENPA